MKTLELLIVTNEELNLEELKALNIEYDIINDSNIVNAIDCRVEANNEVFEFDNLITSSNALLSKFNILKDDNLYITNSFMQSSSDEIFVLGLNGSNQTIQEQFDTILEYLYK